MQKAPAPSPHADYLHTCAQRHGELVARLSGHADNLEAVERAVARARSSRTLTYAVITAIVESPHFSAGKRFWQWPTKAEIEAAMAGETLDLWNLPKNEKAVLKKLRSIFKTFDAASVVLRFVVPKHYGILSSPVEHALGIQPAAESIDRYLNYVKDLRAIRDARGFDTAAQVDQALWTLQLGVLGGRLDDVAALETAHANDTLLRGIRVKNLADGLFDRGIAKLDLAEALAPHRLELASQLAALEFERVVRAHARKAKSAEELSSIIDAHAPAHVRGEWQRGRALRNRAVHGGELNQKEVEELIGYARDVEFLAGEKKRR